MYIWLGVPGLIGGLLGLWKWWLGLVWLAIPMVFILFIFISIQFDEIDHAYHHMFRELVYSYIVNSYVAPILGVVLNLAGIVFGLALRSRKQKIG
jgi:hypothetical protein